MDYEKKYNEAIKRAKTAIELAADKDLVKGVAKTIFPELKESEDERIRRWLYDYISNCPNDNFTFYGGVGKDAVLNYLERQKEQNKCPEFCSGHCGVGCPIYEKQKESKEISLMNGDADLYFDEWNQQNQNPTKRQCFEEGMKYAQRLQKEQKPVEIDEEINRWMGCEAFPEGVNITPLPQAMEIVERTAKHFSELGFELGEKTVPSPGGYCEGFNAGVRECQAKLRDVKGAMKEQKPVKRPKFKIGDVVKFKGFGDEPADDTPLKIVGYDNELYLFDNGTTDLFSEQNLYELVEQKAHRMERYQELVFKDICKHLEVEGYSGWVMFLNALRNGELQPKQEWSEEDEEMINSILFVLESYVSQSYYKEIDWLKSFRPQKLDASKLENFDPVDVLNRIKTEWPTAWEKAVEKQEWNEEEYGRLFDIEHYLDGTLQLSPDRKIACIDFLKSLRPQPKQKWSEEDEMETINVFRPLAGTSIESATKQAVNKFTNSGKKFLLAFNGVFILIDNTKSVQDIISEYNRSLGGKKNEQGQSEGEPNDFEITLNDCMLAAQQYPPGKIGLDVVKMWAKELSNYCPQPNQKWSEFDRHCLERAIWYVENPAPNVIKDTNLVLWLKSFRPRWKPSEEQMIALEGCLEHWSGNESQKEILESLYNQLKKLI